MGKEGSSKAVAVAATSAKEQKEGLGEMLFDPGEQAKVDIVFVHGLNGHRIDTWTWKSENRTQFWPKTLLHEDCPTARIMSFGYNADFAHFYPTAQKDVSPTLTIDNYSTALFQALIGLRGDKIKDRPVIFVAHSLGGLVVANALSRPHGTDDASKELADNTIGTLFLGTPFEGSSLAKYGSLAVQFLSYFLPTQPASLKDLEKRSAKLASINDSFAKFLKERDRSKTKQYLEIACFFEERPLYNLLGTEIGFVVPKESASWLGIDAQSIPEDHIKMCKFADKYGSDYKKVAAKLSQWITDIDKPRDSDSKVGGMNAQSIGVNMGNVDFRGAVNHGGIMAGNQNATAPGAIRQTGTSNIYYTHPPKKSEEED